MQQQELTTLWQKRVADGVRALLNDVHFIAQEYGMPLYLVGGYVRDLFLGEGLLEATDIDLVVEGDAGALVEELTRRYGGRCVLHRRFGTAKWMIEEVRTRWQGQGRLPLSIDFAGARKETYAHPGALPKVSPGTIKEDLYRRDFSINAFALRIEFYDELSLLDFFGGLEDLRNGRIRILHAGSFQDDPTRIFRAIRYEVRLHFRIDALTEAQIRLDRGRIAALTPDRIRHELDHIAEETRTAGMMQRLDGLGILTEIYSQACFSVRSAHAQREWKCWKAHSPQTGNNREKAALYSIWLAPLGEKERRGVMDRLTLDKHTRNIVDETAHILSFEEAFWERSAGEITYELDRRNEMAVEIAALLLAGEKSGDLLKRYLETWKHVPMMRVGDALRMRGVPSGKLYEMVGRKMRIDTINQQLTPHDFNHHLDQVLITISDHEGNE